MKQVLTNRGVAEAWAAQRQLSARSHNGNFRFKGPLLYSYSTPIAHLINGVALITSKSYSATTHGKHIGPAWRTVGYRKFNPSLPRPVHRRTLRPEPYRQPRLGRSPSRQPRVV